MKYIVDNNVLAFSDRVKEHCHDDGHVLGTPHIFEYLWRMMYNRRSKFNPLWNALVVGGIHKGDKYVFSICFLLLMILCN